MSDDFLFGYQKKFICDCLRLKDAVFSAQPQPAVKNPNDVGEAYACPHCGERHCDNLAWLDDESVQCSTCGRIYQP